MGARRDPDTGDWIVPADEQMFIPQPELAARLGLSASTISRWVVNGILPTVNVAGRRHIRRDMIWDWLDEQTDLGRLDTLVGHTHCPHCNKALVE